ncbi:MAG: single-stranded DNA-binding protein, partial [Candidatus Margulisiibacteriota bacterium]
LRYTPSGIPVASFTLAVNRITKKGSEGNNAVDFIPVVAWRRLAEICGEYLKKGRPVAIEGRLQVRSYVGKDGEKRMAAEVVADGMQMLGRRGDGPPAGAVEVKSEAASSPKKEEEIPF